MLLARCRAPALACLSRSHPTAILPLPITAPRISAPTAPHARTMSTKALFEAVEARRTIYALSASSPVPDSRIIEIVNTAIKHVPSSFNSQTARAVILLKDEHIKLWDITVEVLKAIVPAENFPATEKRLQGFRAGYGTVLFFEDQDGVKAYQEKFPLYQDMFPQWSDHASGMNQFVVWTALETEGFGANLQHYNPLIDQKVSATWKTPASWKLVSQLVFGHPEAPAGEKTFAPLGDRVKVYGADQ